MRKALPHLEEGPSLPPQGSPEPPAVLGENLSHSVKICVEIGTVQLPECPLFCTEKHICSWTFTSQIYSGKAPMIKIKALHYSEGFRDTLT